MDQLTVPPHNIEAEQSVLGGLMLKGEAWDSVAALLQMEDFYRRDHRLIYKAISVLHERGDAVDAVTVGELLERNGVQEQIGGAAYLTQLAMNTPGVANITAYAEIVRDRAQLRNVIKIADQIASGAYAGNDAQELIGTATKDLLALQVSDQRHDVTMREAVKTAYQEIESASKLPDGELPGVATGLIKFDEYLGGMHAQDLLVIGARPSMGKTAFMTQIGVNAASKGAAVGIITAEQGAAQIATRMIAQTGRVSLHDMRTGKLAENQWPRITTGMNEIVDLPIRLWDRPAPDITEVFAQAREWKRTTGLKLLLVDYLQLLTAKGQQTRAYEVGAVARGLKQIGRELDCAVVALAQLKRTVDDKGPKYTPVLSDLRDSGEVEQEADQIAFLIRREVIQSDPPYKPGIAELLIRKNRHGPLAYCEFSWLGFCIRFEELAPEPYQQDISQ